MRTSKTTATRMLWLSMRSSDALLDQSSRPFSFDGRCLSSALRSGLRPIPCQYDPANPHSEQGAETIASCYSGSRGEHFRGHVSDDGMNGFRRGSAGRRSIRRSPRRPPPQGISRATTSTAGSSATRWPDVQAVPAARHQEAATGKGHAGDLGGGETSLSVISSIASVTQASQL